MDIFGNDRPKKKSGAVFRMGVGTEDDEVSANLPHLDSLSKEEMEKSMKYAGRNKLFIESKGFKGIKHTKALELSKWKNPMRSEERPFESLNDETDEFEPEEERLLLWEKWQRLGRVSCRSKRSRCEKGQITLTTL